MYYLDEEVPTSEDIIDRVEIGDEIVVEYEAKESGNTQKKVGIVTKFESNKSGSRVMFLRSDGQVMWIDGFGKCYSKYDNFPYNGDLVNIELSK